MTPAQTKPDMSTEDELAAALETSGAARAVPMDVLSDWLDALVKARRLEALAKAKAKEASDVIKGFLQERDSTLGLINGEPACALELVEKRQAPSIKYLEETSDETRAFLKEHVRTVKYTQISTSRFQK